MMFDTRLSSASFASKAVSGYTAADLQDLTDEELTQEIEEATRINRTLTLENDVFERFLRRKSPKSLLKLPAIMEAARLAQKLRQQDTRASEDEHDNSIASSVRNNNNNNVKASIASISNNRLNNKKSQAPKTIKIKLAHRIEVTTKEIEDITKTFREFEKNANATKKQLESHLEEIKYRMEETESTAAKFEKDVVGADPVMSKIPKEKFTRFVEERLKLASIVIDKFSLKMVTAKRLIVNFKTQLNQRKEFGNLRRVDFQKLEIENENLIQENDENHKVLTSIKQVSGHYKLLLKYHKDQLQERKAKLKQIEDETVTQDMEKVNSRKVQVETEREVKIAQDQFDNIKELKDEFEKPEIIDFIRLQEQLQEEKKIFKRLSRERKLQLFALRSRMLRNRAK